MIDSTHQQISLEEDLREYAIDPLGFLHRVLVQRGPEFTREFIAFADLYPFITDLFGEWLDRSHVVFPSEASAALTSITREVIGSMTVRELSQLLQSPLRVIANDSGVQPSEVKQLLRDLHLSALSQRLDSICQPFDPSLLEQVLNGQYAEPVALAEVSSTPISVESSASPNSNPSRDPSYSDFLSELKDAGVIIPPSSKARVKPHAKDAAAIATAAPASQVTSIVDEPTKARRIPKAAAAKTPAVRLEALLSPDAKLKILAKIFSEDASDYSRSIEMLDKAKDWKQASIYLDALFMRRKIDPYSKTATRLSDAVYARFNSFK